MFPCARCGGAPVAAPGQHCPGCLARPLDLQGMVAAPGFAPRDWQSASPPENYYGTAPPIQRSADLDRVLALPRRPQEIEGSDRAEGLIDYVTSVYTRGPVACRCATIDPQRPRECMDTLRFAQAWALREIGIAGGLLGPIGTGHGKCVAEDTEIFDYLTGRRRNAGESGACSVATFDRALSVGSATAFPSGSKPCTRVALADGSSLVASTDHPILTHRGWVNAADLRPSTDFVAVAASLPEPQVVTHATDAEVCFVAYQLSDGGCNSPGAMTFTNATPAVVSEWHAVVEELGGTWAERESRSQAREFSTHANLRRVRDRWDLYGLARHKRAHEDVWGLTRRQVALFLNRFWACDGHVSAQAVECTLASEKLIDDLRFLGSRLGIRFRKQFKVASYVKGGVRHTFDAWRITAYGGSALHFLDEVGDVLGKEDACRRLRATLVGTARNTNRDTVPIGRRELREICDELAIPGRGGCWRARARYSGPSRDYLRTWCGLSGGHMSRARFVEFCATFGYRGKYAHLATTDVAWERVASALPAGTLEVHDLSVPTTHNFVANGIVIHNTGVDVLALLALAPFGVRLGLLLVPPGLLSQLVDDYVAIGQHFHVPSLIMHGGDDYSSIIPGAPVLHVLPYSRLSRPGSTRWIEDLRPQVIIADEVHKLRDPKTATTSRVLRYFDEHPETRFAGWSGSITSKSIKDYAHLAGLALRHASPLPYGPEAREVTEDWSRAIDPKENPADPGALMAMCAPGEHVMFGFRRRINETCGVVSTTTASVDVALVIEQRHPIYNGAPVEYDAATDERNLPPEVARALAQVRSGERPDGETLVDALSQAKCAREVGCGFYYRWIFPHGEPVSLILEWLDARKAWRKELRKKLLDRAEHLDSEALCEHAADRAHGLRAPNRELPVWPARHWLRWREIEPRVRPQTEAVRIDDFLARDAATWAHQNRGIVWYEHREFGAWVAEISGLPLHGGGPGAPARIKAERGDRSIVCSIKAHGTGRDGLQEIFADQLVASPPSSSDAWEQMLARLHRPRQRAPRVLTWFYRHTAETAKHVDGALRSALYVEGTIGARQKLRIGFGLAPE